MKYKFALLGIIIFLVQIVETHAQITMQGKITYTRKLNIHRQFDDLGEESKPYIEAFMSQIPKFDTRKFTLAFNSQESKYTPIKQDDIPAMAMMGGLPGIDNIAYTNFKEQKIISYKKIYDQQFLIQDSLKRFDWKIHDEVRTIAGQTCRKATTIYCDSVVVVAFYAENIISSGGPELFSGLPGMILEIAIPRLYTTWIAESVTIENISKEALSLPEKGKKTNYAEVKKSIQSSMKNWGNFADKSVWWSLL